MAETGGFISSIPALEKAESLSSELVALVRDVIGLDCVSDATKTRLRALLSKHGHD